MRLHGYEVSAGNNNLRKKFIYSKKYNEINNIMWGELADVFRHFKSDGGEFFCFKGQSTQAVTGMYNLYRASQLMFPGENILVDAARFSANFLQLKRANNDLLDKWIITKDLPGEVSTSYLRTSYSPARYIYVQLIHSKLILLNY